MSLPNPAGATAPSEVSSPILRPCAALQVASVVAADRVRSARSDDRGQSTAEYALVILGAAAVALLLVAWASQTDKIGQLLDAVIDSILSRFR